MGNVGTTMLPTVVLHVSPAHYNKHTFRMALRPNTQVHGPDFPPLPVVLVLHSCDDNNTLSSYLFNFSISSRPLSLQILNAPFVMGVTSSPIYHICCTTLLTVLVIGTTAS